MISCSSCSVQVVVFSLRAELPASTQCRPNLDLADPVLWDLVGSSELNAPRACGFWCVRLSVLLSGPDPLRYIEDSIYAAYESRDCVGSELDLVFRRARIPYHGQDVRRRAK